MLKTLRSEIESLGWIVRMATLAAIAGAIYTEMRLPAEERTWHGKLLGFVPYDFRLPSPAKLMRAWWNPGSNQLFGDTPFGVGWSINMAAVADRAGKLQSKGSKRSTRASAKRS